MGQCSNLPYIGLPEVLSHQILAIKLSVFMLYRLEKLVISRNFAFLPTVGLLDIKKELCVIED